MKTRFLTILFISAFILFQSCSKSGDPTPSIVGSWKMLTSENYDCDLADDNEIYSCEGNDYGWCSIITFKADKTFESRRSWDDALLSSGTYIFAQGHLTLNSTTYGVKISGTTMVTELSSSMASCSSRDTYQKQ